MSYKKYKTGTFRVCIFLTILIEVLAFIGERNNGTEILGIYFKNMRMIVFSTPVFIWSSVSRQMNVDQSFNFLRDTHLPEGVFL